MARRPNKLKVIPLGGLKEIGKNMTVVEYKNDIIIVDCGMTFPDEDMLGVDIVIPDISYLEKNKQKIRGIVVTHGHEDHVGAIPYVLRKLDIPVYGTKLTMGLLESKISEHGISKKHLNIVEKGSSIQLGAFKIDFIQVSHSIPDSVSFAIHTPIGILIFTGDFKIDYTPIDGDTTDLNRLAKLGSAGVLALFADSTNVEREGYALSESTVGETFKELFSKAKERIVVATFASNIHRVQQIISAAENNGRKVALSGRSMLNNVRVAKELNYLKMRPTTLIEIRDIKKYKDHEICLLTTGSQGEPMSALSRMAYGDHRQVQLKPSDTVILSASPIPGNEKTVYGVIDRLTELGVKVIYQSLADVHVSGHANREELKLIHNIVKPRYFVPVHGEARHLKSHKQLAIKLGMDERNVFLPENGNTIEFTKQSAKLVETSYADNVLVDGLGVGDVGNVVLRDRKHLSEDGLIVVVVTIDHNKKEVVAGPDIISRGFVYVKEQTELINEAREVVSQVLDDCKEKNIRDWGSIKYKIRGALRSFVFGEIKRNPMILPIIVEV